MHQLETQRQVRSEQSCCYIYSSSYCLLSLSPPCVFSFSLIALPPFHLYYSRYSDNTSSSFLHHAKIHRKQIVILPSTRFPSLLICPQHHTQLYTVY